MIERLKESGGPAFGFKVTGALTAEDIAGLTPQLEFAIAEYKKPIGLLADLSAMHGASWSARWKEMRFLQHHTTQISRLAVVSDSSWEEIAAMILTAAAVLQAETLYFHSSEIRQAWQWAKMSDFDESVPVRVMFPGKGLFQNYTPEYTGL
jgi:stage II sporulation SpoAA-like protein